MSGYGTFSDDFYLNMNLSTELDLPQNRDTVLHFFEQIQKRYPRMAHFYARERMEYVLEEDKEEGNYRWASVEQKRINSGQVNPTDFDEAADQHRLILDLLPYTLSISKLDCESLSVMFGFDYTYRGNHNELLSEALGVMPGFDKLAEAAGHPVLSYEPSIQFALDEDCKTQCRVSFETRTNAYHVRSGDYPEDQLSVYLTVRRYESLGPGESYVSEFDRLAGLCRDMVDGYLIENILRPLQQTISLK
ncbi:hypothetical protein [Candidatus Laterigemmans baculatus]|uniref:hypothetical protein n=1 Tax=Candidatus Laterigemmans baculatus TaxID=2770505 RepID=UPI0013D92D54|nr:hypothetical protein [Candidatus Laterigemmans baculatus]